LEREFTGQLRLNFAHAVLNLLFEHGVDSNVVHSHFRRLWNEHADILVETLSVRSLLSACSAAAKHSPDPADAVGSALLDLFAAMQELDNSGQPAPDPMAPAVIAKQGDLSRKMLLLLDRALQHDSLVGTIGREIVSRALAARTPFAQAVAEQSSTFRQPFVRPVSVSAFHFKPKTVTIEQDQPGYILLNDTGRLGHSFHIGTVYVCASIRQNLARCGLREIGWANDPLQFETLIAQTSSTPSLVVLNGEGTLHHDARRAIQLLELCQSARQHNIGVAVINSVWESNADFMVTLLQTADLIHVRDSLSRKALPKDMPVQVTPDASISLFMNSVHDGVFRPPGYDMGVMDSVVPAASEALLNFAEAVQLPFYALARGGLLSMRKAAAGRSGVVWPQLMQLTDVMAARAWVTGRFHGLIAALAAGRPVCALSSNTAKIEGLLFDAGLADECLLPADWISAPVEIQRDQLEKRFESQRTSGFIERRESYLRFAKDRIGLMFDAVAATARPATDIGASVTKP